MHRDRGRAVSFGGVADLYERARPSYPSALIDDLMALAPDRVIDAGCGTGKAGRLLLARGCSVLGVEPDPRMAGVARSRGLEVEVATFEEWDPRGRVADLIVSGQAWHWVDPERGALRAAEALRDGGHLAAFWNLGRHDPGMSAALDAVYGRLAPQIAATTRAVKPEDRDRTHITAPLAATGMFAAAEMRAYPWDATYTRAEWVDFLGTHSDHVRLSDGRRAALLDAVGDVVDRLGGTIVYHVSTVLVLARRLPRG